MTTITQQVAAEIAAAIFQNEGRTAAELSVYEIYGYLVDRGIEETEDNVEQIRNA